MCSVMMGLVALQGIMQHIQIQNATESQAQAYQAQAEAANQNAQIMERQRDMIAEQYAQRQRVLDDKRRLVLGQQAASAGASGLDGGGSVSDAGSAAISAYRNDSMNLLSNQRNDTLNAYREQVNYMNAASGARAAAANVKRQGRIQLLANFVNTAMGIYGAKNQFQNHIPSDQPATTGWKTGFTGDIQKGTLSYGTPSIGESYGNPFVRNMTISSKPSYDIVSGLTMTKDLIGQGIGRHRIYQPSKWRKNQ